MNCPQSDFTHLSLTKDVLEALPVFFFNPWFKTHKTKKWTVKNSNEEHVLYRLSLLKVVCFILAFLLSFSMTDSEYMFKSPSILCHCLWGSYYFIQTTIFAPLSDLWLLFGVGSCPLDYILMYGNEQESMKMNIAHVYDY